jgi:hypothetical protein
MALVAGTFTVPSVTAASAATNTDSSDTYVVWANDGASLASARAAVTASGGQVVGEIAEIGAVIATSNRADFAAATDAQAGVAGVATNRVVGTLPKTDTADAEVRAAAEAAAGKAHDDGNHHGKNPKAEPLSDVQWDMRMIDATPEGSYREQPGRKGVLVRRARLGNRRQSS